MMQIIAVEKWLTSRTNDTTLSYDFQSTVSRNTRIHPSIQLYIHACMYVQTYTEVLRIK